MSDLYVVLGFALCFAAGFSVARIRPFAQARDWAAWVLENQTYRSFWRNLLVGVLLSDHVIQVWCQRNEFHAARVPDYWED